MRTTVVLEDGLVERAKKLAAETGQNLSQVIELSLRDLLDRRQQLPVSPGRLPVYGGRPRRAGKTRVVRDLTPADVWALVEADDVAMVRRAK